MKTTTQSIIVKKSHPKVSTRADAARIAREIGLVRTSRETGASFRFRQKPPSKFAKGSFRTKRISKHVSLVIGKLK